MSKDSKIQWTDATWNIARGCTKVDEDCKFCYMYRESLNGKRFNPVNVVRTKSVFRLPLKLKEPSKIFTCSYTDFFHEEIDGYRNEAWDIIRKCPQHIFQILTKRPERINECLPEDWSGGWNNVWLGTSVGSDNSNQRIKDLLKVKCKIRFLSLEPLYGFVDNLFYTENGNCGIGSELEGGSYSTDYGTGTEYDAHPQPKIDWVIIGGESGNETGKYLYRPCKLEWIEKIINDCKAANVSVFVKQLGTYLSKQLKLHDRHGGNIEEWPEHLKIREFPE